MSTTPTNVNFDDLIPAPKPDSFNIEWQGSVPVPDPNSPGNLVREVSGCYRVPPVGGVVVETGDYQISETDSGLTLIANASSPVTLITFTLPPVIPSLAPGQGVWNVKIRNVGSAVLTVDPNGLLWDGSSSPQTFAPGAGLDISTDGTNFWTTGRNGLSGFHHDQFTGNGSTTVFPLTIAPAQPVAIVYWNGDYKRPSYYTISGTTFTTLFTDAKGNAQPADTGDMIDVVYFT